MTGTLFDSFQFNLKQINITNHFQVTYVTSFLLKLQVLDQSLAFHNLVTFKRWHNLLKRMLAFPTSANGTFSSRFANTEVK